MLYNMMRPKVELKELDEEDRNINSEEPEQERLNRNLGALLREEMEASFMGFGEDNPNCRQSIVGATEFRDLAQVLVDPNMDSKEEVRDDSLLQNDQVEEA
jgi:hypothetical protein